MAHTLSDQVRKRRHWALSVIGTALLMAATSQIASAAAWIGNPGCNQVSDPNATACLFGTVMYGTFADIPRNAISVTPAGLAMGELIDQSVAAFSGSPCTLEVSAGLMLGGIANSEYMYYADQNDLGQYYEINLGGVSATGQVDSYTLQYEGYGTYDVVIDGSVAAGVGGLGGGTCNSVAGLAETPDWAADQTVGPDLWSTTFVYTNLAWQDTGYGWHGGWNTADSSLSFPCGDGQSNPYCLNGTYFGASEWADNHLNANGN